MAKFWQDPEHPPVEKMPQRRQDERPSLAGRALAGVAALALLTTSALGIWRSVGDKSGGASPFGSLALLIPAVVLLRYAFTGQIRLN